MVSVPQTGPGCLPGFYRLTVGRISRKNGATWDEILTNWDKKCDKEVTQVHETRVLILNVIIKDCTFIKIH